MQDVPASRSLRFRPHCVNTMARRPTKFVQTARLLHRVAEGVAGLFLVLFLVFLVIAITAGRKIVS